MVRAEGEEAGFTARVEVKHGLPRELHTTGRICDILGGDSYPR